MLDLNTSASTLMTQLQQDANQLRVVKTTVDGFSIWDFGIAVQGGLAAGCRLAEISMAGLGQVTVQSAANDSMPHVVVTTDHPLEACLMSQYAGWKIATDDYFAMASGPMRAIYAHEDLFTEFAPPPTKSSAIALGVLEAAAIPTAAAKDLFRQAFPNRSIELCVAPTSSLAGTIQVVARSVETALHKLHEIDFPVSTVVSGFGSCPLPPIAQNDLEAIGRTNDAILYGATVHLWVDCDDSTIQQYGPLTPSNSSPDHGRPFVELFKAANYDFYGLDKNLFSPARVCFHSLTSGRSFEYGVHHPQLLAASFGLCTDSRNGHRV